MGKHSEEYYRRKNLANTITGLIIIGLILFILL